MTKPFEAKIYCGLREEYSDSEHTVEEAEKICQGYVNDIGWCVTVVPTRFIYKDGNEDGVIVGVIYYPRFPLSNNELIKRTIELAKMLKDGLCQIRVSVVFNNEVKMIGT